MSKSAAAVLAFIAFILFSIPMSAQFNGLLPNGNVYAGVSYAQLTDVINTQSYRGWTGSFEALPFTRFPRIGLVADGSGYYRSGVKQYNIVAGPRLSAIHEGIIPRDEHRTAGLRGRITPPQVKT